MHLVQRCLVCLFAAAMTACGGGAGGGTTAPVIGGSPNPPAPPVAAPTQTLVSLQSDAADVIGQGKSYSYATANANITWSATGNHLYVTVQGDQQWEADFQTGGTATELKVGTYTDLDTYLPSAATTTGGVRWYGEGRGCHFSKGWFAIDSVTYSAGTLKSIAIRFERQCDGATAALHGTLQLSRDDKPADPAPAAVPSDLWTPPAGFGSGGNELYLESGAGDYIGQGKTYRYNGSNSEIYLTQAIGTVLVSVRADQRWGGTFVAMQSVTRMAAGYYANLRAYPYNNPVRGGLSWMGEGRGCNVLQGWFAVDAITYADGVITAIDLRFEQRCEGRSGSLRGALHWRAFVPAAPTTIAPSAAGSWRPAAPIAAAGSYLYLEGGPRGTANFRSLHMQDAAHAVLTASVDAGHLQIDINGEQHWQGDFQLNGVGGQVGSGLYDGLVRYLYAGQAAGGMNVGGENLACDIPRGWLAIDSIGYSGGKLSAIDLRFEQVCDGQPLPFRGMMHWRADDTTAPAGPSSPPPDTWRPAPEAVPAAGNYYYVAATERGDGYGFNANLRYTPVDARISVSESGGHLGLQVDGDEHWRIDFQTMSSLKRLQPGYYDGLRGYPSHNPARGGLGLGVDSIGCNEPLGSVIVDSASYENDQLSALALRYEYHCGMGGTALRGALRWSAADHTVAAGPQAAIPASLWRPAAGATPASGNYVFLQSEAGDPMGGGKTVLNTAQNSQITLSALSGRPGVEVNVGPGHLDGWQGTFVPMDSLTQIQPGFYDRLQGYGLFNPARGGFSWDGMGVGCNTSLSWVAVDSVTYVNGRLTALHARFEQHCEDYGPALHGEIHWAG